MTRNKHSAAEVPMTRQQALSRADQAPRCQHSHLSGRPCGSPALAGRRLCYFHQRALRPKLPNYKLPLLEDATSVQFGLVQVARALEDKAYDIKTSALLLYALQTASANLRRMQDERDWERRELQAEPESTSNESFADLIVRGLGLREPDPPPQPPPFDIEEESGEDLKEELSADETLEDDPQAAPARRRPSSARPVATNDKRRATND